MASAWRRSATPRGRRTGGGPGVLRSRQAYPELQANRVASEHSGGALASDTFAKLAVLIDADNVPPAVIEGLLAEVAKYGTAHVKRAYGDWTGTSLRGWKEQLLAQSIQPIQQFAYTIGKNATDAAMVIDAMDLLYSGRFDGFCLVSSDSALVNLLRNAVEASSDD